MFFFFSKIEEEHNSKYAKFSSTHNMISFEFVQVFENMQMRNNVETEEQLSISRFLK